MFGAEFLIFMKDIFLSLILSILITSAACSTNVKEKPVYQSSEPKVLVENKEDEKRKATAAVENFHKLFNEGKNQEIFELIDDKSQLRQDKVYMVLWMEKLNRELGKFENSKMTNQAVFQKNNTYEVRFELTSKYEKESGTPPRYELFAWEVYNNGNVKLLDYINGKDKE